MINNSAEYIINKNIMYRILYLSTLAKDIDAVIDTPFALFGVTVFSQHSEEFNWCKKFRLTLLSGSLGFLRTFYNISALVGNIAHGIFRLITLIVLTPLIIKQRNIVYLKELAVSVLAIVNNSKEIFLNISLWFFITMPAYMVLKKIMTFVYLNKIEYVIDKLLFPCSIQFDAAYA